MNIKRFISFLCVVVVACFAASCKKGGSASESGNPEPTSEATITLSVTQIELSLEETFKIEATVAESRKGSLVFWSVRDKDVAEVTDDGVVKGIGVGNTILYAQCGDYTALCAVTVLPYEAPEDLTIVLPKTEYSLNVGDKYELPLKARFGKDYADGVSFKFQTDGDAIVVVGRGSITANKQGSVKVLITATYVEEDTEFTAYKYITVYVY